MARGAVMGLRLVCTEVFWTIVAFLFVRAALNSEEYLSFFMTLCSRVLKSSIITSCFKCSFRRDCLIETLIEVST